MGREIDENKIRNLDPKIKIIWEFPFIAGAAIFYILMLIISPYIFQNELFGVQKELYPLLFLFIVGAIIIPHHIWIELWYKNYTYYLGENEMIIRRGVFKVERYVIPYERIQNVNVSRSIVERILGLATLKIETAATNPAESEGFLPGISNYKEVVNEIMNYVEKAKNLQRVEEKIIEEEKAQVNYLVKEIEGLREEIKKLREVIEEDIKKRANGKKFKK